MNRRGGLALSRSPNKAHARRGLPDAGPLLSFSKPVTRLPACLTPTSAIRLARENDVQAIAVACWVTLICGFALWPFALIRTYVYAPASGRFRAATKREPQGAWIGGVSRADPHRGP
ncbi:DUF3302 domain-containing protein [Bradyrhizobium japonicum]|uniref:DUF3302 domain-containing protein n=1 Tax=Bradyrhizobium japonicum TaxID=375 RepID=UPI00117E72D4|nr:DUF3302 domain-containing protein [Bradyrhizobium japonicum]